MFAAGLHLCVLAMLSPALFLAGRMAQVPTIICPTCSSDTPVPANISYAAAQQAKRQQKPLLLDLRHRGECSCADANRWGALDS